MNAEANGPSGVDFVSLLRFIRGGEVSEAISVLEAISNPTDASVAFIELARQVYRELKDVSSMIALGNAGTQFALLRAASSGNSAEAEKLRKDAKILAFNTAANCWPGWGDVGIDIKEDHLQAGLKLAVLCRDLVVELSLGQKQRGTSQWLIGALDLAMGRFEEALAEFQRAKEEFQASADSDCVLMAEGYSALALKAQPESRLAGGHELDRILLLLRDRGSKDGQFFANQLVTADRILIGASLPDVR
jgi:tetratricopeptide (TPR) repeat protein